MHGSQRWRSAAALVTSSVLVTRDLQVSMHRNYHNTVLIPTQYIQTKVWVNAHKLASSNFSTPSEGGRTPTPSKTLWTPTPESNCWDSGNQISPFSIDLHCCPKNTLALPWHWQFVITFSVLVKTDSDIAPFQTMRPWNEKLQSPSWIISHSMTFI